MPTKFVKPAARHRAFACSAWTKMTPLPPQRFSRKKTTTKKRSSRQDSRFLPSLLGYIAFGAKLYGAMNKPGFALSVAILLFVPLTLLAAETPDPPAAKTYLAYVGNYTTKTESKGIYLFTFDPTTGKMSGYELAGQTKDPSWVLV